MFPLHDNSRRRICLTAFFGLCVVPTVIVLACGLARHLPGHARAEAQRLTWQLGQKVSMTRFRHLRPRVVLYEGLELSDPETGSRILRCRTLEARWEKSKGQSGRQRPCLVLIASRPEIEADQLGHVWRLARAVLTGQSSSLESDLRLAAGEASLRRGEASLSLTQLQGRIARQPGGSQADLSFHLVDLETPEPVQIRVARNHQSRPPATGLGIHTGGGALPCSLLALALPELEAMGPQSRLNGYLWANETPEGWGGEVAGQFSGVDVQGLIAPHFPHTLSGTAELRLQKALWRRGRLQEAAGSLVVGPGLISRSLLDAAADRLGMTRGGLEPDANTTILSHDGLALSFRIDSQGLQLRGACPPDGSRAILVGRRGILLSEPAVQPIPVAALVQTLVPAGTGQVPATSQTDWLMRRLPIPDAVASRAAGIPSSGRQ